MMQESHEVNDRLASQITPGRIHFIIASIISDVRLVGLSVNKLCVSHGLAELDAFQLELCVVEAVTNAIEHAHQGDPKREVKVTLTLHDDRVEIDVWDKGRTANANLLEKLNRSTLEHVSEDMENLSLGGRGLAIIKEIMDTVSYRSSALGNCLTMVKKITVQKRSREDDAARCGANSRPGGETGGNTS